ncbi:MAG: DUF992 domain-containing protein, partial [Rhizobiales bacterium]|nr:DUF992 domain-containing protein [Hyphomicrobiales bacterium]
MRLWVGLAFAGAFFASASSASAQSTVETGVLECQGQSMSFVVASVTNLDCLYRPSLPGRVQAYRATIKRVGVDIGINQSTRLSWAVFAPTHRIGPGALAGAYLGASANATFGVGLGVNALFGGSNNTISLQPVSAQGQVGIGAAGGISSLELVPVRQVHRSHRK